MKKHQTGNCAITLAAAAILSLASTNAVADIPRMSAGVNVGSLGAGATLAVEINRQFEARVGLNQSPADFDVEVDGLSYNGDISLNTTTAIVDFYPWLGLGFRLSAGAFLNGNEVGGTAQPAEPVNFGGQVFQPEDIGSATAAISFPSSAPYVGLGWGRRTGHQGRLKFSIDAGVFFQGTPTAAISVENPNGVISEADIAQARSDVQEELNNLEIYPVLSLGVSYSF